MRIDNGRYREVVMNWSNITLPLKAGTPISAAGTVANNGNAIGLVPDKVIAQTPMPRSIFVLDAGDVDLAEVETLSGLTLSTDAKAAMSAIRFHKADGTIDDSADSDTVTNLPFFTIEVTEEDDYSEMNATWADIETMLLAGVMPVVLRTSYNDVDGDSVLAGYVAATVTSMTAGDHEETPFSVTLSDESVWEADDSAGSLRLAD